MDNFGFGANMGPQPIKVAAGTATWEPVRLSTPEQLFRILHELLLKNTIKYEAHRNSKKKHLYTLYLYEYT